MNILNLPATFLPARRLGVIYHAVIFAILAAGAGVCLWLALQQQQRNNIVMWLVISILLMAPIPLITYRGYSLLQARYILERDGVRIRWGLRAEDISLLDVEWIRPAGELGYPLHLPVIRWPGAIYGTRRTEGLGEVDFIASDIYQILLIATRRKVYAISPDEPRIFLNSFLRTVELGSLTPLATHSTLPAAYLRGLWGDHLARTLIFLGFLINLLLFAVVSLMITDHPILPLGYDLDGMRLPGGPSAHVLLLPFLGGASFILDLIAGMYFFRRTDTRLLAYLMWGSSAFLPILLLLAASLLTA